MSSVEQASAEEAPSAPLRPGDRKSVTGFAPDPWATARHASSESIPTMQEASVVNALTAMASLLDDKYGAGHDKVSFDSECGSCSCDNTGNGGGGGEGVMLVLCLACPFVCTYEMVATAVHCTMHGRLMSLVRQAENAIDASDSERLATLLCDMYWVDSRNRWVGYLMPTVAARLLWRTAELGRPELARLLFLAGGGLNMQTPVPPDTCCCHDACCCPDGGGPCSERSRISKGAPSAEALYYLELAEAEAGLWCAEYALARQREINPSTNRKRARLVERRDEMLKKLDAKRSIGQNALAGLAEGNLPTNPLSAVVNVMMR